MRVGFVALAAVFKVASVVAVDSSVPQWFTDCLGATGGEYRRAAAAATNAPDAVVRLQGLLDSELADCRKARLARILLARAHHPEVFRDFEKQIGEWRAVEKSPRPRGTRPGQLSGHLLVFTRMGPESCLIEEYVRDNDGKIVQEPYPAKRDGRLKAIRSAKRMVERYTEAEVKAGIARNAAARQAVLEHFLKFLDEGDAYEQSEMVDLVNRLWGRERIKRDKDLAVVDNVPDADALIEAVYKDDSRPLFVRYTAALWLPKEKQGDFQGFMLNIVAKSMSADFFKSDDLLNGALNYLGVEADAAALAALKSQTNGPKWKVEAVIKTTRKIESRVSKDDKRE